MTTETNLDIIKECLEQVKSGSSEKLDLNSNLTEDGILDSLDAMTFIFKLEKRLGKKLTNITEGNIDLSVKNLLDSMPS